MYILAYGIAVGLGLVVLIVLWIFLRQQQQAVVAEGQSHLEDLQRDVRRLLEQVEHRAQESPLADLVLDSPDVSEAPVRTSRNRQRRKSRRRRSKR